MLGTVVGYGDCGNRVLVNGEIVVSRNVKVIDRTKSRIVYVDGEEEDESSVQGDSSGRQTEGLVRESESLRRSSREKKEIERYGNPVAYMMEIGTPGTYEEAINDRHSSEWKAAME